MNRYILSDVLGKIRRCAFFSLVTAPSLLMFLGFAVLSFNNSIAGSYLDDARQRVANAPADKVWSLACLPPERPGTANNTLPPALPDYLEPVCTPHLLDASDWQQDVDAFIRRSYVVAALLGLFVLLFTEGFPRLSFEWLTRRKTS